MKAKYIGNWINHEGRTVLKYEYRGKFYEITDYGWVVNHYRGNIKMRKHILMK